MSRTFRRDLFAFDFDSDGAETTSDVFGTLNVERLFDNKKDNRDRKPWGKSPAQFKKFQERQRRAKRKAALRAGKEPPVEKKTNDWEWA